MICKSCYNLEFWKISDLGVGWERWEQKNIDIIISETIKFCSGCWIKLLRGWFILHCMHLWLQTAINLQWLSHISEAFSMMHIKKRGVYLSIPKDLINYASFSYCIVQSRYLVVVRCFFWFITTVIECIKFNSPPKWAFWTVCPSRPTFYKNKWSHIQCCYTTVFFLVCCEWSIVLATCSKSSGLAVCVCIVILQYGYSHSWTVKGRLGELAQEGKPEMGTVYHLLLMRCDYPHVLYCSAGMRHLPCHCVWVP